MSDCLGVEPYWAIISPIDCRSRRPREEGRFCANI
jgi:hypothetical protein